MARQLKLVVVVVQVSDPRGLLLYPRRHPTPGSEEGHPVLLLRLAEPEIAGGRALKRELRNGMSSAVSMKPPRLRGFASAKSGSA